MTDFSYKFTELLPEEAKCRVDTIAKELLTLEQQRQAEMQLRMRSHGCSVESAGAKSKVLEQVLAMFRAEEPQAVQTAFFKQRDNGPAIG